MRSGWRAASAAAVFLLWPALILAGVGVWTTTGPEGATVLSLALDPRDANRVYAGTDAGGVFASSDAGTHWTFSGPGRQRIVGIVADPVDASRLYARSTSRLYRSADRGASWTDISAALPLGSSSPYSTVTVSALGIEAGAPGAVYAGVTSATLGGTHTFLSGTLYKSSDGGEIWTASGLSGPSPGPMAFDPEDSRTLYVGVTAGGIQPQPSSIRKSVDGGLTWTTVRDNLPPWATATAIAADPARQGRVVVAYSGSSTAPPSFVEMTSDGGSTWLPLASPPSGSPTALGVAGGFFYLATTDGLYRSSDEGSTWTSVLGGAVHAIGIASAGSTTLYSGGDGVSLSRDFGESWSSSVAGLTSTSVASLQAVSAGLYAFAGHTIFRRSAGEDAWRPFSSLPAGIFIQSASVHPTNPSTQLAGVMTYGCAGVLVTTDGGVSWAPSDLKTGCILRITFDPRRPDVVFAQGQFGLWRSTDGGTHWGTEVFAAFQDLAFPFQKPDVVFAATNQSAILSDDGGVTWLPSDAGIPLSQYGCSTDGTVCPKRTASAIAIDPRDPLKLYAAAPDVAPYSPFAAPSPVDTGFFRSTDGGATWQLAGSGLSDASNAYSISAIVVDPGNSNNVYAATDRGVFESSDQGRNFRPFNEGLVNSSVRMLLFDTSGRTLHAATQGNGVFDIDIPRERPAVQPVSRRRSTIAPSRP